MSHAARLMNKKVAVILVIALVLSALVGPFGLGVASASEDQVSRVEGENRYETAANIAKAAYPDGNDTVIVARGENVIADALAASVLAGAKNAPILLTKEKSLPPETRQAIEDLGAEQVYILGNEYAISKAVEDALKELVGESNVKRVSGNDRYETAVAVAKEAVSSAEKAYLANGEKTADALVAGPAAFVNQVPVLLVKQDSIPDVVWEALDDLGVEEIVLVGSVDVISKAVEDALKAEGYDVRRVGGKDRFETSVDFAKSEFPEAASYGIVKGQHDKDAESGVDAVAAVVLGQPLLYATKNGVLNDTVQNFIAERAAANPAVTFTIFGDENAVVADVDKDVQKIIEENAEVKVVSVSAISQTIKAGEEQALKFMVNGKEVLTAAEFKEKYGVAGYTVEFLYNKADDSSNTFNKETGVVQTTYDKFKYAVQVRDAEGNVIPEGGVKHTDFVEVKVVQAEEPVKVTALGLVQGDQPWKLDYITMTDENVKIVVTEAIDAFGEKISEPQVEIKAIKSSDITVAYYDDGIVPRKAGQVTFTVEFDELEAVVFPLEIREGQKADSIAIEQPVKVKADAKATVEFDVLDQYGEKLRTEEEVTVTIGNLEPVKPKVDKNGKVSIEIELEEGTHKAVVKAGNKQIGTFTIEAVNVQNVPIDEYTFKLVTNNTVLDMNPKKEGLKETIIEVKAYVYGVEADLPEVDFIAKSSSEEVVKVAKEENNNNKFRVTAEGVGSATITLYIKEHDLETPVARLDVTVKNTTPQINDLQLKEGIEKLSVTQDENGEWQLANEEELVSKDTDEFSKDMVEEIIYSPHDGKAVVILKKEYGGKSFVFPAEIKNTEETSGDNEDEISNEDDEGNNAGEGGGEGGGE